MNVLKSERIRLKKARNLIELTTGQEWSAQRFTDYLAEHKIQLVTKQGQPCKEFAEVHPSYGTAAISSNDLAMLVKFFESTSVA